MARPRILLADGHPDLLAVLRDLVGELGEVVGTVRDGQSLVEAAQRLKPDIIFTDISMPKMNGIDATRALQVHVPQSRIIILSSYHEPAYVTLAFNAGARGYILKTTALYADWLELVEDEVRDFVKGTFLEGTPLLPVSSRTMVNLNTLKEKIREIALQVEPKPTKALFRLPIDRVFTLKGFGTVVTGTAVSGSISIDQDVDILPSDIHSKVRGLHSHGKSIQTAYAGQRVAINLQGVEKEALQRGDAVVIPGRLTPTRKIDAKVELLADAPVLKNKSLVHFQGEFTR